MTAATRPVVRYHGGKWRMAPQIIALFPAHRVYVEPFGGGGSVLLRKPPVYAEVYNDLDGEVVNLFRVLRDRASAKELERLLRLTPFAREEFEDAYEPTEDSVERARRALVRAYMGFGSAGFSKGHATGFRHNTRRSGTTPAADWAGYPEQIARYVERLAGVVIDNRRAEDLIPVHDGPDTLFYVDPPYPHSTREEKVLRRRAYAHEMTDDDHRALAQVLRSAAGCVVLSGYACDLYDAELYPDWERREFHTLADGALPRTEVVWLNLACSAALASQRGQLSLLEVAG